MVEFQVEGAADAVDTPHLFPLALHIGAHAGPPYICQHLCILWQLSLAAGSHSTYRWARKHYQKISSPSPCSSSLQLTAEGSEWKETPDSFTLGEDSSKACVLPQLPEFLCRSKFQLPTVVTAWQHTLQRLSFLLCFTSYSAVVFLGIILKINCLYSNPCLRVFLGAPK